MKVFCDYVTVVHTGVRILNRASMLLFILKVLRCIYACEKYFSNEFVSLYSKYVFEKKND